MNTTRARPFTALAIDVDSSRYRLWLPLLGGPVLGWLLHEFAAGPVAGVGPVPADVVVGLAESGQFILPIVCAVLAGLSVRPRASVSPRVRRIESAPDFHAIEPLLRIALTQRGFAPVADETPIVARNTDPSDLPDTWLRRHDGESFLLRWRHLADACVGASAVESLKAAQMRAGARGGFLVTSGGFTREACALVHGSETHLVDGARMVRWVDGVRAARPEAGAAHESVRRAGSEGSVALAVALAARTGRAGTGAGTGNGMSSAPTGMECRHG